MRCVHRSDLTDVRLYHLHTAGPAPFVEPACHGRIRSVSLFTGGPVRQAIQEATRTSFPFSCLIFQTYFRAAAYDLMPRSYRCRRQIGMDTVH